MFVSVLRTSWISPPPPPAPLLLRLAAAAVAAPRRLISSCHHVVHQRTRSPPSRQAQERSALRQHFLNFLPEPHAHGAFGFCFFTSHGRGASSAAVVGTHCVAVVSAAEPDSDAASAGAASTAAFLPARGTFWADFRSAALPFAGGLGLSEASVLLRGCGSSSAVDNADDAGVVLSALGSFGGCIRQCGVSATDMLGAAGHVGGKLVAPPDRGCLRLRRPAWVWTG